MSAQELKNAPFTKEIEEWRKKLKEKADKIRKKKAARSKKGKNENNNTLSFKALK